MKSRYLCSRWRLADYLYRDREALQRLTDTSANHPRLQSRLVVRDGKIIYSKGNDHIIDAVRRAMLIREESNLDPVGEEVLSLKPVLTNPVFI